MIRICARKHFTPLEISRELNQLLLLLLLIIETMQQKYISSNNLFGKLNCIKTMIKVVLSEPEYQKLKKSLFLFNVSLIEKTYVYICIYTRQKGTEIFEESDWVPEIYTKGFFYKILKDHLKYCWV